MLGSYDNFPTTIHRTARFSILASARKLQQVLIETFQRMNNTTFSLDEVADPSVAQCNVNFEFGIAEGSSFNYLDNEETDGLLKAIHNKPFQTIDILCAVCYHRKQRDKGNPLKFDYYIFRLFFNGKTVEMVVFHERGPRHISPDEIVKVVINQTNKTRSQRMLRALDTS